MNEIDNWTEETRSAYLYRVIAGTENGTVRESLFHELAKAANRQAAIWEGLMEATRHAAGVTFLIGKLLASV